MTAFDKILAAVNLNDQRGNWFYQTDRNKIFMVAKAAATTDGPKAVSVPSSPVKSEGPAPPTSPTPAVPHRTENPVNGMGIGEVDLLRKMRPWR